MVSAEASRRAMNILTQVRDGFVSNSTDVGNDRDLRAVSVCAFSMPFVK